MRIRSVSCFTVATLLFAACNPLADTTADTQAEAASDAGRKSTQATPSEDTSMVPGADSYADGDPETFDAAFNVDLTNPLDASVPRDPADAGVDETSDSGVSEPLDAGSPISDAGSLPVDSGVDASIACPGVLTSCGGKCVYTDTSLLHCGVCGNACVAPANAAATCASGACAYDCLPGFKDDGAGGCAALPPSPAIDIVAGRGFSCILRTDGTVGCWGAMKLPYVPSVTTATAIAAAGDIACAVLSDGGFRCWYGSGSLAFHPTTYTDLAGKTLVDIARGLDHTCARTTTGTVYCWGERGSGYVSTPVAQPAFANAVELVASQTSTAAIFAGGTTTIYAHGKLPGISGVTAVALGGAHTCAVVAGGAVICSGYNQTGECGDGTGITDVSLVYAKGVSGATEIAANYYNTCAVISDGTVQCWGRNVNGEGGYPTGISYAPHQVTGVTDAVQIAMGESHTCVLKGSGAVQCWGSLKTGP